MGRDGAAREESAWRDATGESAFEQRDVRLYEIHVSLTRVSRESHASAMQQFWDACTLRYLEVF